MVRFIQNNFIGMPNPFITRGNCCHNHNNMMPPSMFGYGFQQPMIHGGCVHHSCNGGGSSSDDGIGKALLWGAGLGAAAALLINFRKPIGQFLVGTGKLIGQGVTWLWNKALKPAGQAIGKFFTNIWNGIKGIFKKKPKNAEEVKTKDVKTEDVKLLDSQVSKPTEISAIDDRPINDSFIS